MKATQKTFLKALWQLNFFRQQVFFTIWNGSHGRKNRVALCQGPHDSEGLRMYQ